MFTENKGVFEMGYRIESDSIGSMEVPENAYYGVQSLRGATNFKITGQKINGELIISLAQLKKATAMSNMEARVLEKDKGEAIIKACDEIIEGKLHDEFIVDEIQGGAGTSINMNANEVIANRANEIMGGKKGTYDMVHPNDHVNMGQSTNDVIPSAGNITTIKLIYRAIESMNRLKDALLKKSEEFSEVIKMGRTQLQDAVPITLGQEFGAYAAAIKRDINRMGKAIDAERTVNMGGTAVGTGINADRAYEEKIVPNLTKVTGIEFKQSEDLIDGTQNLDKYVEVSSVIKTCAVNLSKIANDLRLMSSGPRTGIGEINLPSKQNGSSIMPGKINPVIPEVINQIAFNVIGNDMTITMAAEAGQLELNAFEPVIFFNLFESIETLYRGVDTFVENCILGITANEDKCKEYVERSVGIVTALCPYIGYKESARIAKKAIKTGMSVKEIILEEKLFKEEELETVLDAKAMLHPGIIGKKED